jgi:hypothetical protein
MWVGIFLRKSCFKKILSPSTKSAIPLSSQMSVVINPRTQRPVKVGSRTWRKLVSDGVLNHTDEPEDGQLYTLRANDDPEEKIQELNTLLPPTVQAVRGRGRYSGKIVKRRRQPSTERVALHTIQKTAEKIRDRKTYENMHSEGDFDNALEELIMQELTKTLPISERPQFQINEQEHYNDFNEFDEYNAGESKYDNEVSEDNGVAEDNEVSEDNDIDGVSDVSDYNSY